MVLTGINIRSGLELEVPVADIFNVNVAPDGNILAKHFHESKNKKDKKLYNEVKDLLEKDQFISYNDLKINNKLNDTLNCYIYDSYFIYEDEKLNNKITVSKTVELMFINTEQLSLDQFSLNLMTAQSFSGNFVRPEFNYPFIGVGDFDLEEYIPLHQICAYSNLNLVNFYIYHKKILSSIGYFICGLFENDIREQRKYITEKEFKDLLSLVRKHKKNLLNAFKDLNNEGSDLTFF